MNVVDSSGWLEYFAGTERAQFSAPVIERIGDLIVRSITLYEVFKRVLQQRGDGDALQAIALMSQGQVVTLDAGIALSAAHLSADLKLPMADSIILATARAYSATLWTQDSDFQGMEGVRYLA